MADESLHVEIQGEARDLQPSAAALCAAIAGSGTNRDRVLAALREGGERGVTDDELRELVGVGAAVHMESLRYEGHRINTARTVSPGRSEVRYTLAFDAWEGE